MLRSQVIGLKTVADCRDFLRTLDYQAIDAPATDGWTLVARWKHFHVLATETATPVESARLKARSISGAAHTMLVMALQPGVTLAVAAGQVGAVGSSPVLVVSVREPSRISLRQLEALRPQPGANTLSHALHVLEVLSNREVGEKFFTSFRCVHHRMVAELTKRATPDQQALLALLPLTRVLFLYFIQAKGWLDGRPDYLRTRLDGALSHRRPFHRNILNPLFFGTLNRPADVRDADPNRGRIPYLNGGLFELHPVEDLFGAAEFPNRLWRDAFDDLFERYRFSIRENAEIGVVAPDMLGRVFERVMDVDERHATGTYYTPEGLVQDVVRAAIVTALTGPDLPVDSARRIVLGEPVPELPRQAIRQRLHRLTVLDPAVGSGAFLLGALDCLTDVHLSLCTRETRRTRWVLRRRIVRENLFGVDLSPVAVRLAELRLWLAIVADDPTENPESVEPLPNLDGVVRQGDSLLDPVSAVRALGVAAGRQRHARSVAQARRRLFNASRGKRSDAVRDLRVAELSLALEAVTIAIKNTLHAMRDLAALAGGRDLFGRRTGLTEPQRRRYRSLRRQLTQLEDTRTRIEGGTVPFFSFEVHRPDALARGGFSIVLGNPPWVRAERLSDRQRRTLKERFSWWRSAPSKGFGHLPDLSVAFLQRAMELTAPGGAVGFLVPSKIISATYGSAARNALVRETTIASLYRVPDRSAARFGATTYPLVLITRNSPPPEKHLIALELLGPGRTRQKSLSSTGPWILAAEPGRRALDAFLRSGTPLSSVVVPSLGVKTGADSVFVGTIVRTEPFTSTLQTGVGEIQIENRLIRPVLRGRDIRPFTATPRKVLIWTHGPGGHPLPVLPEHAGRYIESQRHRLIKRADHTGDPIWRVFRTRHAFKGWRVVWPDIARRSAAVTLNTDDPSVPLNTCYVAVVPDQDTARVVTALLNSTWVRVLLRALADEARGGYRRHNAAVVARVPIPEPGPNRRRLARYSRQIERSSKVDQESLDGIAAHALGLSTRVRTELARMARDLS